ncbi:unnamed protein product [Rotaria magnacalcarata]|uniref:Small ribosomal subunit protein mS31 n=2 Tax=Rotaria magnacalcarata TaxID=392030 RepID=A0A819VYU3_9BILA|nr:unnamed protein product [Rotaria magnacalcarata]CAF2194106.1 unnamed protein product [Rotaria magnacalcarata]CAF4115750.1 unnamed protein product [Rotaria magnacalcarata]CAF4183648.1 unnamed protein product [Rotaria magnacalcarata]
MLTLRRISTIYQYLHPLSSCQYRFKSKQSGDDESKGKSSRLSEELLNFERKNINTSRNVMKDHKNPPNEAKVEKKRSITRETLMKGDGRQAKDLLRSLNVKNSNHQKQSLEQRDRSSSNDRVNLAKPLDTKERKQNREGEHDGEKDKKIRPQVILDTESSDVKLLTRRVADSLTSPSSPNESSNIEQELLDVLRGHRVVSKKERRTENKPEHREQHAEFKNHEGHERPARKKQTRSTSNVNVEKTTEAFSSLLRDFQLKPTRTTPKFGVDEDLGRDEGTARKSHFNNEREQRRDSGDQRKLAQDTKRRQEFFRPHRLWTGEPLGIFTAKDVNDLSSKSSPLWEKYENDELIRTSTIPPRNGFEEMIQWTKDGIIWKFPVDNEQDIGPVADVPFYEHVLLERHLKDFPQSPLIRQFMELVCVGLGRNPYWTVEQKVEHINWFRTYFNDKMHIFNETVHTGAIKTSAAAPSVTKPVSTFKPKAPPAAPKVVPVVAPPPPAKPSTASKN